MHSSETILEMESRLRSDGKVQRARDIASDIGVSEGKLVDAYRLDKRAMPLSSNMAVSYTHLTLPTKA